MSSKQKCIDKLMCGIGEAIETLAQSYDEEKLSYKVQIISAGRITTEYLSRENYLQFLIDSTIDRLMNAYDEAEELRNRLTKIKPVRG